MATNMSNRGDYFEKNLTKKRKKRDDCSNKVKYVIIILKQKNKQKNYKVQKKYNALLYLLQCCQILFFIFIFTKKAIIIK